MPATAMLATWLSSSALIAAAPRLRRRFKGQRFDIVHAHFGLTAWPALLANLGPVVVTLHGNDLLVRRSNVVTRAALPFCALTAAVSIRPNSGIAYAWLAETLYGLKPDEAITAYRKAIELDPKFA